MSQKIATVLLVILLLCPLTEAAAAENKIFLIDTSGSMRKGGLFENIKSKLKELVRESMGSHVQILTFDENVETVVDRRLNAPEDIDAALRDIDGLKATGPWTWMTEAFKKTLKAAEDLKGPNKYPKEPLIIYLLTDGRNDPPPQVNEPPLEFVGLLKDYFGDFKIQDTYIYLLSYRPLTERERTTIEEGTTIRPVEPPPQEPIPNIKLMSSNFNFGEIEISQEGKTLSGWIRIDELPDAAKGGNIHLTPSAPEQFKVTPETIPCVQGQEAEISILLPASLNPGGYTGSINFEPPPNTMVAPSRIPVSFTVIKPIPPPPPPPEGVWKLLLFLGILALLAALGGIGYMGYFRRKPIWIQKGDDEGAKKETLQGWRKTSLDSCGLPNHFLRFKKFGNTKILGGNGEADRKIALFDAFPCRTPDGEEVVLTFYETDPQPIDLPPPPDEPRPEEVKGPGEVEEKRLF